MSEPFRESLLWTGIGLGIATAIMTFFAGNITLLSGNGFIATLQVIASIPMLPGLISAAMIGSLAAGALINVIFYSFLGGLLSLLFRKKDRFKAL